jgi:hypothetical protein
MSRWNAAKGLTLTLNSLSRMTPLVCLSFILTPSPDCARVGLTARKRTWSHSMRYSWQDLTVMGLRNVVLPSFARPVLFLSRAVGPMKDTGGEVQGIKSECIHYWPAGTPHPSSSLASDRHQHVHQSLCHFLLCCCPRWACDCCSDRPRSSPGYPVQHG